MVADVSDEASMPCMDWARVCPTRAGRSAATVANDAFVSFDFSCHYGVLSLCSRLTILTLSISSADPSSELRKKVKVSEDPILSNARGEECSDGRVRTMPL